MGKIMHKTILLTGATDGIGLKTAEMLVLQETDITLLLHGRSSEKLAVAQKKILMAHEASGNQSKLNIEMYLADLSDLQEVSRMANAILQEHKQLDVIINNAGILKTANPVAKNGMDVRFLVNTLAPYLITQTLLPIMKNQGRVVNLSSAAQKTVDLEALSGKKQFSDYYAAYAQSKLAITMWSKVLGEAQKGKGPLIVSVNPGSLLGSKMVTEGFGVEGGDLAIGADILIRAALSEEFENRNGEYYDNDAHCFADPHADALVKETAEQVTQVVDTLCKRFIN